MKSKILGLLAMALLAGPSAANAAPVNVSFEINTTGPTVGSFTFDSSLDGGVIGYSDLSAFSITLWNGSMYDLAFINTSTFDFREFAFDSSVDMFVDLSTASGMISAIRTNLADGFWVSGPGQTCGSLSLLCVADYPGANFGADSTYDTITATRVSVPEPGTLALLGLGLLGLGVSRRKA